MFAFRQTGESGKRQYALTRAIPMIASRIWRQLEQASLEQQRGRNFWELAVVPGEVYAPLLTRWFGAWLQGPWRQHGAYAAATLREPTADRLAEIRDVLVLLGEAILVLPAEETIASAGLEAAPSLYALSTNFKRGGRRGEHTPIGQMEYDAKYLCYGKARQQLGQALAAFARRHPEFRQAQSVVPVPPDPGKTGHLPNYLAEIMARAMGIACEPGRVRKRRRTGPLKDLPLEEKRRALEGAMAPFGPLEAKHFIVVDDLIQSGTTMLMTIKALLDGGAASAVGLACVKSLSDDDNISRPQYTAY